MSKKIHGLCGDGVMRSVMCLTGKNAHQNVSAGMQRIQCIFMSHDEEWKHSKDRSVLKLEVSWGRNDYVVVLREAKGCRYRALGMIPKGALKIPLRAIEMYLEGESIDTRRWSVLERQRFNRLMGALQELRDEEEIRLAEGLAALSQLNLNQEQAAAA